MESLIEYELKNDYLYMNLIDLDRILEIISVISVCLIGCDIKIISRFLNKLLIPNLKYFIGYRKNTNRLSFNEVCIFFKISNPITQFYQAKLASHLIKLSSSICKNSPLVS